MQVQIAELYCNNLANVFTKPLGGCITSHASYSIACNHLLNEGFSFSKETKSSSGGQMEWWKREVSDGGIEVFVPTVIVETVRICTDLWCEGGCEGCNPNTTTSAPEVIEEVVPIVESVNYDAFTTTQNLEIQTALLDTLVKQGLKGLINLEKAYSSYEFVMEAGQATSYDNFHKFLAGNIHPAYIKYLADTHGYTTKTTKNRAGVKITTYKKAS